MIKSILAVCVGASGGATLRWLLGLALNSVFPVIPLGTLAANLLGSYCMGAALGIFYTFPLAPAWRLLCITGLLGALTTFSTFSAEVATLLQAQRFGWACGAITLHVGGSLLMVFLGMGSFALVRRLF